MTLIIGAVNRQQAVLVSDRRVTCDGRLVEDESNKAATLICRDAIMVMAFTGLARLGPFLTRRWLLEAFSEAAMPDSLIKPMIDRFAKLARDRFAGLSVRKPSDKRLSVLCVGYEYDDYGPRALSALISNFEKWEEPSAITPASEFSVSWIRERRPPEPSLAAVVTAGIDSAVSDEDVTSLRELLQANRPAEAIVGKSVDVIRSAADSPKAHNAIGKQCTSVILPSSLDEQVRSVYHSAVPARILHGVSHIEARGGEFGIFSTGDPEMEIHVSGAPTVVAGPKLRRNQLCWCESGKKYKKCHGR
jgi:hypothetical protein